jgi:hypothetical protein
LWVGGSFTNWNNNANADHLCYWDGTNYYALSTGLNNACLALAYDAINDRIYLGGDFTSAGAVADTTRVCSCNFTDGFLPMSAGANSQITALAVDATGGVYVGGAATTMGGVDVNGIGYWNGVAFTALGSGVGTLTQVLTIAIRDTGDVWLGGAFTTANGVTLVDRMAVWSGSVFYSPEVDLPGSADVNVIAFDGDDIYIGSGANGTATYSNTTTVTNNGTEPSNPIFYVKRTGGTSAKLVRIENATTRKRVILDYNLLSGEEIKIDLRPGKKRITSSVKGRGSNTLNVGSDLSDFVMIPGDNTLAVMMVNVGSPTIAATVEFDELFLSFD